MPEETIIVNEKTGGRKASKLARYGLIPTGPLRELAEHYGKGCQKYADRNWELGYDWDLSYDAAQRHLNSFWNREDFDPETRSKHVIAAAWHCLALAEFMETHPELDNRPPITDRYRPTPEEAEQCCERDHDYDGNCDRHADGPTGAEYMGKDVRVMRSYYYAGNLVHDVHCVKTGLKWLKVPDDQLRYT